MDILGKVTGIPMSPPSSAVGKMPRAESHAQDNMKDSVVMSPNAARKSGQMQEARRIANTMKLKDRPPKNLDEVKQKLAEGHYASEHVSLKVADRLMDIGIYPFPSNSK